MARALLDRDQIESLRTASKLARGVVIDSIDSDIGPVKIVGVGSLVFDKRAFVGFWFWRMSGCKIYLQNFEQNKELTADILLLNPELHGLIDEKTCIFSFVHWMIHQTIEDDTVSSLIQTFENTLRELSE